VPQKLLTSGVTCSRRVPRTGGRLHNHRFVRTLRIRQALGLNNPIAATTSPSRDALMVARRRWSGVSSIFVGRLAHGDRQECLRHGLLVHGSIGAEGKRVTRPPGERAGLSVIEKTG
jgi:hypothetical protein